MKDFLQPDSWNSGVQGWQRLCSNVPLKIVRDGPMADQVRSAADNTPAIEWFAFMNKPLGIRQMQRPNLMSQRSADEWFQLLIITSGMRT